MRTRGSTKVVQYVKTLELEGSIYGGDEIAIEEACQELISWMNPKKEGWLEMENSLVYLPYFERELIERYTNHMDGMDRNLLELSSHFISKEEDAKQLVEKCYRAREVQEFYVRPFRYIQVSAQVFDMFRQSLDHTIGFFVQGTRFHDVLVNFLHVHPLQTMDELTSTTLMVLETLGLHQKVESAVAQALGREVEDYFTKNFAGVWDRSVWTDYEVWMKRRVIENLERVFEKYEDLEPHLVELGQDCLARMRTLELFDMVLAYPGSMEAIKDLKEAMHTPLQRATAVNVFQKACTSRLLQGGANTIDIVQAYIAIMRAFGVLDHRGVLLDKVSRPVRRYLRDREDTIAVIISGLLGNESSSINELADLLNTSSSGREADYRDDLCDLSWNPDPVDAPPDFMKDSLADIVGSLLSIYDNKEVFVRELMSVFANQLLSQNMPLQSAVKSFTGLQSRFEERELQSLDVMMRDMAQSKTMDELICNQTASSGPDIGIENVHATIVSRLFWPSFREETLQLPSEIEKQLENYAAGFTALKKGRNLTWIKNLGLVTIELALADRTVEFQVAPYQASVILEFQHGKKTLADIMAANHLSEASAKNALSFWVSKGILQQTTDGAYEVLENEDENSNKFFSEDVGGSAVQSAEERAAEEMKVYWQYIVGMLTNLGPKPLGQVHSFLKMLVPKEAPYVKSQEELEQYLSYLVEDQKLEFVGGNYKLLAP